ncbi:OsmC family protein [Kitasatospora herbaricolor]|uniref:OsmC family protein n=1 Tax=Kitasatospora herbaricolor TaxID=68217 RepID=A0ABZ1W1T7_9ACTN|nr:OsmC family protein [Kitasatospora herbaricolor]
MTATPADTGAAADTPDTTTAAPEFVRSAAVLATSTGEDYRVDIRSGRHHLTADEPASAGGGDTATTPVGLLLSALGSCTAITLRMYAQRKQWPLETVRVHLGYEKGSDRSARITRRVDLVGDLDEAQRARLLDIAERTPVTLAVAGATPVVAAHSKGADRA